jgi:hypothetical protein
MIDTSKPILEGTPPLSDEKLNQVIEIIGTDSFFLGMLPSGKHDCLPKECMGHLMQIRVSNMMGAQVLGMADMIAEQEGMHVCGNKKCERLT